LSIDLDYWSGSDERSLLGFFGHVFDLKLPIFVAPFHDQLLDHINQHPCTHLYQIDFHSDISDFDEPAEDLSLDHLNEGTWANFVAWKQTGHFVWRYPSERLMTEGLCYYRRNPFDERASGWQLVTMTRGLSHIPWKTV
jgi:hypothetical protein